MAEETISVVDVASAGVVIDTPPIALASNVFTDVRNIRFKDGAIRKINGEILLNNITSDLTAPNEEFGKVRYFAVWENPNVAPLGLYYIFVVDYIRNNITIGQKVYIQDQNGTKKDITPSNLPDGFSFTTSGWQHTLFTGGFAFILNNGIEKPHYILDVAGNTDINTITLAELPGWDSYHVEQEIFNDVFSAGNTAIFDLGQKVDFTTNFITVTGTNNKSVAAGNPAGTGTPNTVNFVPGILPASPTITTNNSFNIYTDTATNTTVLIINGLTIGDTVTVKIESRNPVTVSCGIVESFGDLLVAGDLTEVDSVDPTKIIRRLSGVVRTSDVAAPGSVPNNWNPFSAGVSTADEFTLSETNTIEDMRSLQGNMYIYSNDSIHIMRLTGNLAAPVSFSPVTDEYGCITTGAVKEYDGKHFVVGGNDIYVFAGNPGDIKSLADNRVAQYFFNNLNPIHQKQLFIILNHKENEIWVNYPTLASLSGECDEALIWNYRDNTWTIRDLDNVTSGDYGPIKGGGIPTATIAITGDSGNAGYTNTGKREIQVLTVNGNTPKATIGTKAIKTVAVSTFPSFTTDVLEVVDLSVTGDTGPITVNSVTELEFPSATSFVYDRNQVTYLDGGASAVISGDASIGSVSFPAIAVLGTSYADGATITIDQFVDAVKDYINSNLALADFTASASSNTLTLTSDVPGNRAFSTSTFAISGGATANLNITVPTTGVGVYGITAALSPAISMTITAAAVSGVHNAINETITFAKNLTSQTAIRDDIITKLSALNVFNGSASSIYSVSANGNNVRFTSTYGGNHSTLNITFSTNYSGTSYPEIQFGGNVTDTVTVVTQGVNNNIPKPVLTITFPDGTTSSQVLSGTQDRASVVTVVDNLINANANWSSVASVGLSTATASAVGVITNNFSVAITSTGTLPPGFSSSNFTSAQTRAGVAAHSTTDRITITPPIGSPITVNFDDTNVYPSYDPDTPGSIAEVTDVQIAQALEAAWVDTTYFTVSRANEVLTFTSVTRSNPSGVFNYTIVNGDTRNGTLVTPLVSNASATVTDGIDAEFAQLTRVTITLQTLTGTSVIFDRHYGEGPGRLLDPNFTLAANDDTYGDTSATSDADYLNLYYDPDKDLNRTNTTEQAKPNGEVVDTQTALLAALAAISGNQAIIVTPDSASAPTTIDISPSQFSATANYVSLFSPDTEVIPSTVAPTTVDLIAVAEGNTVATTTPTFDTTGTTISTTFDIERPWANDKVNPIKSYPILLQSGFSSGTLFNRIRAADVGYTFDGTPFISYVERQQLSIVPNFDTETMSSIALWADGGTITTVGGLPQRATLQIRARATNSPGELPYLTTAEDNTQVDARRNKLIVNDFVVASDYKADVRITGRFLNYRIDDANSSTASGYVGSNTRAWNISGFQLNVGKAGVN